MSPPQAQSRHLGQVIGGIYREWTEVFTTSAEARSIVCVSELKPEARTLTTAQAQALLSGKASSVAIERAAASDETDDAETGVSFAHDASVAVATRARAMTAEAPADPDSYAILDGGYGKTPVAERSAAAAKEPVQREKQAVLGKDERTRVTNSGSTPWNQIGQLIVTWQNGTQSICTGTLISPHAVLTAGQCAHDRSRGGFAARTSFAPGQTQATSLGAVTQPIPARFADYVETTSRWTQISGDESIQVSDSRNDYAVYYFVKAWSFPSTGAMRIEFDQTKTAVANHAGYPVEVNASKGINQGMWTDSGGETTRSVNTLRALQVREFNLDSSVGSIGGPIWTYDGANRTMIGLVSFGSDDFAGGVWFGGENKTLISAWAAWAPGQPAPVIDQQALRAPFALPSTNQIAASYFRISNMGLSTGRVTVKIADATTGTHLGTWTSPLIRSHTSYTFGMPDMERQAEPPIDPTGKENYTLTISTTFQGFFQHVLWNNQSKAFTNVAGCSNGLSDDVTTLPTVHSSATTGYPSYVSVHNQASKAADAMLGVYNAEDGARIGGIVVPAIPANGVATFLVRDLETALNYTSVENKHYNLVLEGDFYGYGQHLVYNEVAGFFSNLTSKCVIAP